MLLELEKSGVLLIDVQKSLTPHVMNADKLIENCHWTMKLAKALEVPTVVSEQYPQGLGETLAPLNDKSLNCATLAKVHFSCGQDAQLFKQLQSMNVSQWILIGIETHVCVMQTAIDLLSAGFGVYVVVDAVSARNELDHRYGLKRMKQHGAELITREMVFFEWIKKAGNQRFKDLSQMFLRSESWK